MKNWRSWTHGDLAHQEEHVLVQEKLVAAEDALSKERRQHKSLQEEHLLLQQKLTAAEEALSKERHERETLQAGHKASEEALAKARLDAGTVKQLQARINTH